MSCYSPIKLYLQAKNTKRSPDRVRNTKRFQNHPDRAQFLQHQDEMSILYLEKPITVREASAPSCTDANERSVMQLNVLKNRRGTSAELIAPVDP